ncbi:MAG: 5'-3' exonuclease H3TH domain-containing protein, partial [Candidatus Acidiferrales bacterium]
MPSKETKRLFLVDAMGYIFRAYFAPMERLQSGGIPTKVPYLFATMMRRLLNNKERRPDYLAVVYDHSAPTFRDKIFAAYKAQRPPMPDELSIQMPFVRRYCEAMRLPILEYPGYEADDVIGSLARQARQENLEVFIVTSDKDLMQLVEELMGVPPHKVPDVMALMGDSIDNIPGARDPNDKPAPGERRKAGIGDVGARQLIQQFGSAEEALKRASEVKRSSYREALEKCGEFVMLSKQLSTIPLDAPVPLDLEALKIQQPHLSTLRDLYAELGFTSLLRELAPVLDEQKSDYTTLNSPDELRTFLKETPRGTEVAAWLTLDAEEPDDEGYGTYVRSLEVSSKSGTAQILPNDAENKNLAAWREWLGDSKRPKIVHDPKLFNLLAMPNASDHRDAVSGIRHATMLYSYLIRPTTANHEFAEVVLRHLNRTLSGAPGERADFLIRIAPILRAEVEKLDLLDVYEKIDLPLAPVLARMEAAGVRVDKKELDIISKKAEEEITRLEK